MTTPPTKEFPSGAPVSSRRLWLWFLSGFAIVFVGILLFMKTYDLIPSGRGVVQMSLWQYYAQRLPKLFAAQPVGPSSGSSSGVMTTLFQHTISAALGGAVTLAIGWKAEKRRQRRSDT